MPRARVQNTRRLDHNEDLHSMARLPLPIRDSPATSRSAYESFRSAFARATRREKGLPTWSFERIGRRAFDRRKAPTGTTEGLADCQISVEPQVAARSCLEEEGRPRRDIGCSPLG